MAFDLPPQWGAKATSPIGTADYFDPPPIDYRPIWPRFVATGGGGYEDGLPSVVIIWGRLTQEQYAVLTQHYAAAQGTPNAGAYYVRYWNERANSGAGGYETAKCHPRPPEGSVNQSAQYYTNVTWRIDALGVA